MSKRRHQIYSVTDLLSLQDDPNRWIVPRMIQKSNRILVFGEGGNYKSTVVFDLCVAVASQGKLLRQLDVLHHGPVLLNSTEGSVFDNKDRLLSHMRAHGANPMDTQLYFCQQPFCLDDAMDVEDLEKEIKRLKPILVVLDPLDSFFSGDENSAKETKALRRQIDRLIDEYKCTFIVIHHQTKGGQGGKEKGGGKPTPRGSSAWYGWADAVLHFSVAKKKLGLAEPTEILTIESLKQRNGKKGRIFSAVPQVDEVLQQTTFVYYDGKDSAGIVLEYYKHQIYKTLRSSPEPMTNVMIADALGVRQEKIVEALNSLEAERLIKKDAGVERAFGVGGSRTRVVAAWRALIPLMMVDAAAIMVKDEESELQQGDPEALAAAAELVDAADDSGVREDGAPAGPGVSPVLQ
jgi:RecA-family ATPase